MFIYILQNSATGIHGEGAATYFGNLGFIRDANFSVVKAETDFLL